ncbi:MAG: carbon-nitrogen hydrolase family protein [Thermoprotei archaeon]|nr:MAG: carbon-nitrogen hydrolase family protein [Thermoprotei archaeon]
MIVRLVLAQLKSVVGDKESNLKRAIRIINKYKSVEEPTLIVFPELYLTGYLIKDLVFDLAEQVPGPSTGKLEEAVYGTKTAVVMGLPELHSTEKLLYNSAVLISGDGSIGIYRKRHLPSYGVFDEARYFKSYKGKMEVFNVFSLKVGLLICYDAFFPELSRTLSLKGAEILVTISAAPDMSINFFETFMRARAMENTVYTTYVNTVGFYNGLGFFGGSHVNSPLGTTLVRAEYFKEDVKTVRIDLREIVRARKVRPLLKDFEPLDVLELYREVFS